MGIEQDPAGASSSAAQTSAAAGAGASSAGYPPAPAAAAAPPPAQPHQPPPQQYGAPPGIPPHQFDYSALPPNYYAQHQQQPPMLPTIVTGSPPVASIVSPEDARKIRKMGWGNFAFTMIQLICSMAIILMVRQRLSGWTRVGSGALDLEYSCHAATRDHPSTCEYAYSLASISVFFCFILSLMQCMTMDCCGMGRAIEAGFDAAACAWWIAGAVTLGLRASEANAQGVPQQDARNAVVALSWLSAVMFLALFINNCVLIKRLGMAYKAAQQQMQQHLTAQPAGQLQMQMVPLGTPAPAAYPTTTGSYPQQPGMPVSGGMYGAPYPGAGPYQPGQQQQQQQWGPAAGYPITPPNGGR